MVAVSGAGMLPPVITVKMQAETKFAIIKFSSCFYKVALNEELEIPKSKEILYSSDRAKFRNFIIGESVSVKLSPMLSGLLTPFVRFHQRTLTMSILLTC